VLLLPRAAQAFKARCAIPIQHKASKSGSSRPAIRLEASPISKPRSPQAAFAQKHGSSLATCKLQLGPAKLGGQAGVLITTIDPKQNKASIFCPGMGSKHCVVRFTQPMEKSTAWSKALITKTIIKRDQFAYRISSEDPGGLLIVLFGPDIAAYQHLAPVFTSDPAQ
jgi:hypothetical protein